MISAPLPRPPRQGCAVLRSHRPSSLRDFSHWLRVVGLGAALFWATNSATTGFTASHGCRLSWASHVVHHSSGSGLCGAATYLGLESSRAVPFLCRNGIQLPSEVSDEQAFDSRAARRRLFEKNVARAESSPVAQRRDGKAGGLAAGVRPPQHLGTDPPRGLLEIRRSPEARRVQTWFVCPERQQFLSAAGARKSHRSGVARGPATAREGAPRHGGDDRQSAEVFRGKKEARDALRRGTPRRLPRRTDPVAAPTAGTLRPYLGSFFA